ncbi:TipAS antibiotic-recognition domain [Syntrophomonas zehnderi OL-4]|uniref:TipAS antibiotic-recognition domain n=1 Tax=Syntrophomonas zehnderi OL-4 TaxID=690567 RepID=A0A0E3W3N6_9FIRM|nr:MerR family transcriptional regulator [Syntrophomonas zehnderi]CFX95186.1 TipAS antibiotic-recognition domain [Syntrophomonas zehnderi OL-4]
MEYTVQKLSRLAGISSRTLRYYDEIGILKPARINSSGYRIYGQNEVDRLQQILFYRELGVSLDHIKEMLTVPDFDRAAALRCHREKLLEKKAQLELLIMNVEKTLAAAEGRTKMSDQEKFQGFKQKMIEENEEKYGKEIREKYGEETVARSNQKFMAMTEEQYAEVTALEARFRAILEEARQGGDPAGALAQQAADLHRQWLAYYWSEYSKEAHAGVARMYVEDERFKVYYDRTQPGTAEFLREAVLIYTGMNA